MKKTPARVCPYFALLVLAAGLSGCQTQRSRTAAGGIETLLSAHERMPARGDPIGVSPARVHSINDDDAWASDAGIPTKARLATGSGGSRSVWDAGGPLPRRTAVDKQVSSINFGEPFGRGLISEGLVATGDREPGRERSGGVRLASWASGATSLSDATDFSLRYSSFNQEEASGDDVAASTVTSDSKEDLETLGNKQINPLSDLWSLVFQYDATSLDGRITNGSRTRHSLKFQPVMPMELTEDVRLIVRPVFNLVNSASLPNGRGGWDRDTNALGDTQLALALSPAKKEAAGWFWGVGATFNFPTSTLDSLGTEKWAVGPSATVWHFGDPWIFGVFAQSLFSFAGDSDRESINILDTQVFALYQIPDTQWKVGMTPNITYDFKTEQWNVPVGLGATTIVKLFDKIPTRILFEVQYYLEQDDNFGPEWNFRFLFAPIVPKPKAFQKPLLG